MKKRLLSLILVFTLAVGLLATGGCGVNNPDIPEEMRVTRGEWIKGLCIAFGMSDYSESTPFFKDVEKDSNIYGYVQSCAEWGIFEKTGGNFKPNELLTREFAVKTAVVASEVLNSIDKKKRYDKCIDYAYDNQIILNTKRTYLKENITIEEAQSILEWAVDEYFNRKLVEYSNVELNRNVTNMTSSAMDISYTEARNIITLYEKESELNIGDIFITPATQENPAGTAEKVAAVYVDEMGNTVVETVQPTLEEIYKELNFAVSVVPDMNNIVTPEGVTVSFNKTSERAVLCNTFSSRDNMDFGDNIELMNLQSINMPSSTFSFNFTEGKPEINAEWENAFGQFVADVTREESADAQKGDVEAFDMFQKSNVIYNADNRTISKIENKYSGGYNLSGYITIKDLCVDIEVTSKEESGVFDGIQSLRIDTDYTIETAINLEGELEEELTIASIPIAVPAVWGLVVNVEIILYSDINGEIEVKLAVVTENSISYYNNSVKKTTKTDLIPNFTAAASIEMGAGVAATLELFSIDITNVKLKAGTKFDFTTEVQCIDRQVKNTTGLESYRGWYWSVLVNNTAPVVTLELGTGSESLLALNMKWQMVGENGLIKIEPKEFFRKEYFLGEKLLKVEPNILQDSSTWLIDQTRWDTSEWDNGVISSFNIYLASLKEDWTDGGYTYHDLRGNSAYVYITYWDSKPFNVYEKQDKEDVLCSVHGINFNALHQCKETGLIYGYVYTTKDDFYDPFDFEGYGWVDPRELEDGFHVDLKGQDFWVFVTSW